MNDDQFFYNRKGEPIDVRRWAELFEDQGYAVLARTRVGGHVVVTKWLGTRDELDEPPTIFGSIVKTGKRYHDEIRTATEDEALQAHVRLVNRMVDQDAVRQLLEAHGEDPP